MKGIGLVTAATQRRGGLVHVLVPRVEGVGVAVRVSNLSKIERFFGWGESQSVMSTVRKALVQEFGCSWPEEIGSGVLLVYLDDVSGCVRAGASEKIEVQVSRAVGSILLSSCIANATGGVVPEIEVFCAAPGESASIMSDRSKLMEQARVGMVGRDSAVRLVGSCADEYVALMGRAASFLAHLMSGDVVYLSHPVVRGSDGVELYASCVPATLDAHLELLPVDDLLESLRQVAPAPVIEEHLVWQLMGHLESSEDLRLGIRFNGSDSGSDQFFDGIIGHLKQNRALASRLTVEIDGALGFCVRPSWVQFCTDLKSLGATLVLDRFGAGNSAVRDVLVLQPDFVKLEPGFLWRAQSGMETFQTLRHLIGLVHSLKAPAIVCGVDSAELAQLASDAGGVWQSGRFYGQRRLLDCVEELSGLH